MKQVHSTNHVPVCVTESNAANSESENFWLESATDWVAIIRMLIDAGANVDAYHGMTEDSDRILSHYESDS